MKSKYTSTPLQKSKVGGDDDDNDDDYYYNSIQLFIYSMIYLHTRQYNSNILKNINKVQKQTYKN